MGSAKRFTLLRPDLICGAYEKAGELLANNLATPGENLNICLDFKDKIKDNQKIKTAIRRLKIASKL